MTPPIPSYLSGLIGLLFITNEGMAASFSIPSLDLSVGDIATGGAGFRLQGALAFQINNTNQAVDEEFIADGNDFSLHGIMREINW